MVTEGRALFFGEYGCSGCHQWDGKGKRIGPDLTKASEKFRPDWLRRYLADPSVYAPKAIMPALFFRKNSDGTYVSARPQRQVLADLDAIVAFLLNSRSSAEGTDTYLAAKKRWPDFDMNKGKALFEAMNCVSCHRVEQPGVLARKAPPLGRVYAALNPNYLSNYLRKPRPVRPFGYRPGDGARMPNFKLSDVEVAQLVGEMKKGEGIAFKAAPEPAKFRVSAQKVETLVRTKLSCLGCHQLGGEGGRIAPALDNTGGRVRAQYIYNMLKWPRETVPEAVMPTIRFRPTPKILDLVYAWLSEQKTDSGPSVQYLSPLEVQPHRDFGDLSGTGQALYMANCAHCHGVNGQRWLQCALYDAAPSQSRRQGTNGFTPRRHSIRRHPCRCICAQSESPNAQFGMNFSNEQIRSLVAYIRTLCQCTQPQWAGDGLR